jgi:diadenosine tetraphosphatase ApaH/serine/threonine PP2A family protein phosphatase
MEIFKGINVKQHPECKLLINPGSIGQPRDSNARSSAVIYDSETGDIELFRIDYDIRKTQEKIIKAQLPQVLADRLSRGR